VTEILDSVIISYKCVDKPGNAISEPADESFQRRLGSFLGSLYQRAQAFLFIADLGQQRTLHGRTDETSLASEM
jgi:hypothetical protein